MNGTQLIKLVLVCFMTIVSSFNLVNTISKRTRLGSMVHRTMSSIRYGDKTQLLFAFGGVALWVFTLFTQEIEGEKKMLFIILFVVMISYLLSAVLNLLVLPGIYEKGVSTGSGMFLFEEIRSYSIARDRNNDDHIAFYINPGRSNRSNFRIIVHAAEEKEIKAILKKKCHFK